MRALLAALLILLAAAAPAQDFSALARLDVAQSQIRDDGDGLGVELHLSQTVPYRAYTLAEPWRLVLDFRELDFRGATRAGLLNADNAEGVRFGPVQPGLSRLVLELGAPMRIATAGLDVDEAAGTATLRVSLVAASAQSATAVAGAPASPGWPDPATAALAPAAPEEAAPLTVVIDPGHGGLDPGAQRAGLDEADVMLTLALELSEALTRAGMRAVLTRTEDVFVPLQDRISIARAAGADVMISLHADALEDDEVTSGASIYTLSASAENEASSRMAERHERGDILGGLDLSGQDDSIATILMELARTETGPSGLRLADALLTALREEGARLRTNPQRQALLAVLTAADFPAVLLEVGFLSSARDRAELTSAEGRAKIIAGITSALRRWAATEEARAPLLRQ
ncbi:N-acetylmuramoyl-L-alanine amidase [Pseudoroseicyclus tamaricis]|uniref:N-acetylmuramoyl-L-alanine amidase n=1 Tax=Pseudoroseicyclus tamaricis TaxID=2705421 RepID=A0A6B2JQN1_9RHOB|nr:N-acetylmuramoyl-L-alanine amidase [Pseudoroseicyclus tamaricis]NDV00448.1 N-acetylmuramoyl-L-alanine amidase [Pseudoroseicyclus tamaricis]